MKYYNPEKTLILKDDGTVVPTDPTNSDYVEIVKSDVQILPYVKWNTIEEAKASQITKIENIAKNLREKIIGTNDSTKIEVYTQKYQIALKIKTNGLDILGHLTAQEYEELEEEFEEEAFNRNLTKEELADVVIGKGNSYRLQSQKIENVLAKHKFTINGLGTIKLIEDYDVELYWPEI